ncbi:hypothetical protein Tco_0013851 [Tanacetum coccineum]
MTGLDVTILLLKLLGKLGVNDNSDAPKSIANNVNTSTVSTPPVHPLAFHTIPIPVTLPPGSVYYPPTAQYVSPIAQGGPPPGFGYQLTQDGPAHHDSPAQHASSGPTPAAIGSMEPTVLPGQETTLPHAFTVETLTGAWNINTVGDGHSIPVTNTGHNILPTPSKSLHLNNGLEYGRYGVSNGFDTAYWGFLRVGTTEVYAQICRIFLDGYGVLDVRITWAVDKNSLPRIKGTLISSGISKIIKSTGKTNLPIPTSTFSAIPFGYFTVLNCAENCQVKYATCTLLDGALTWWNSHVQSVGIDAAYETT